MGNILQSYEAFIILHQQLNNI